jgi:Na+-transporting NADH:ubiquinone oxidoreductase subunit NqrF
MWETRVAVFLTFATVVIAFVTAVIGIRRNSAKLDDIHILVNSNYTAITKRVDQLIGVLHEHGIDIPAPPEVPPPG